MDPTIPSAQSIGQAVSGNLTPGTPFSSVYSYDQFWNPQRDYISGLAASQYRPEYEANTINPYNQATARGSENLLFNQGLGGTWRTGAAGKQTANFNNERTLGLGQLESAYGNTIQGIINQYQTNVANPLYQDWWKQWDESPTQNVDAFRTANPLPTGLAGQYQPNWGG